MFNSLNNIYSLALKKSDKTPEAIIKLGDILRYVIYEAKAEKVKLSKEIKLIHDYIDLQKIRTRNARVVFNKANLNESQLISPLLFLPLIENGFKHGIMGDREGYLTIEISEDSGKLLFITENNKGVVDKVEKEEYRGIGIENVKRRLEISYPGKHEFHTFEDENRFRIELSIQLENGVN
jgi:LytS/YehU family sensor histidine kinase